MSLREAQNSDFSGGHVPKHPGGGGQGLKGPTPFSATSTFKSCEKADFAPS